MKKFEEIISSPHLWGETAFCGGHVAFVKLSDCGTCSVIWNDNECGYEHVSVSPKHKYRIPSWEDMCRLKDIFFRDDEEAYQIHPKKTEYCNLTENCLHLWKPVDHEIGELINNG